MRRLFSYVNVWLRMSRNAFLVYITQRLLFFMFLFGKLARFSFFLIFIYFLVKGADSLAGYSINQTIFFFLTFNVVDVISQFLFREVYRFRSLLISGDFDLILVKPMSALFRVLLGGADIIDLVTIPPLIFSIYWVGRLLDPNIYLVILFLLLIVNALILSTAFHIAVLSMGIITLEIDHTIMIYRDITNLGKFPVDIYKEPLRGILTFLIPVGIMITLPAKALMGLVTPQGVLGSFALGLILLFVSVKFWNYAVRSYSSASS